MKDYTELFDKINALVDKAPENRHSYYQLKHFVIGKQPTTQAQLWQCLIELQSKKETIDSFTLQIEDLRDELELFQLKEAEIKMIYPEKPELSEIDIRKAKVLARMSERKQESIRKNINRLEKQLDYAIQEARFFVQAFESLEKIEKVKDYDDLEAQKELWEAKIAEEINLKLLFHQPLSSDTLKTALSLHPESSVKAVVVKMMEHVEKANVKMLESRNKGG